MIEYIASTLVIGGGIGAIIGLFIANRKKNKLIKKAKELGLQQLNNMEVKNVEERNRGSSITTPAVVEFRERKPRVEAEVTSRVRETAAEQPRGNELPDFSSL